VVQERFIEADAVSDAKTTIPTGTLVRVVDIRADLLVVEEDGVDSV
jgi:membrane-bound ClpP family serine protease